MLLLYHKRIKHVKDDITKEKKMSALRDSYEEAMQYFKDEAREFLKENSADGELYYAALTEDFNLFYDKYRNYQRDRATDND